MSVMISDEWCGDKTAPAFCLCDAAPGDEHWSYCPAAKPGSISDDDPDADPGPNNF